MSNYPYATIHVKYYLFSQVGTAKNVSIISSANPHRVNIYNSFNNSHTIVEGSKPIIYNRLMKYFSDMTLNRQNHAYGNGKTTTNGPFTVYIYPQRTLEERPVPGRAQHGEVPDRRTWAASVARSSGWPCGASRTRGWTWPRGSGRCTTPAARSTSPSTGVGPAARSCAS